MGISSHDAMFNISALSVSLGKLSEYDKNILLPAIISSSMREMWHRDVNASRMWHHFCGGHRFCDKIFRVIKVPFWKDIQGFTAFMRPYTNALWPNMTDYRSHTLEINLSHSWSFELITRWMRHFQHQIVKLILGLLLIWCFHSMH